MWWQIIAIITIIVESMWIIAIFNYKMSFPAKFQICNNYNSLE